MFSSLFYFCLTGLLFQTYSEVCEQVFYRPDALPVTQPTVSEHWRNIMLGYKGIFICEIIVVKCDDKFWRFLANVNSRSRSLYAVARPSVRRLSVCRLSVCNAGAPTQQVEIFGNVWTPFGTLAIHWHPQKMFAEIVPGEPLHWGSLLQEG